MNTTHNATRTATRIHPLMALAAGSVILVSLAGTAAITGLLPNSKASAAATLAPVATQSLAATPFAASSAATQPVAVAQQYALVPVQTVPVAVQAAPAAAAVPMIKKVVYRPRPVQHTQVARYEERDYDHADQRIYSEPVRVPQAQPVNYVGIGAGALIGGLVGHQVGGGNGKKLATVAGLIGGGMLGNEIANRSQYGH